MSLPWVKLRVALVDNDTFKALTPGAKLTFYTALALAQKQDQGGRLYVRGVGPMRAINIAPYTGMGVKRQQEAIDELCGEARFLSVDLEGTLHIERFDEVAGEESKRVANAERQRRHRNGSNGVTSRITGVTDVTGCNAEIVTDIDKERDKDKELDFDALRSSAIRFGTWPEGAEIAGLALIFLHRFGNCKDPAKAKRYLGAYATLLASMRQRGVTITQAWRACEDCWSAGGEVPLFGGKIKQATSFLPPRPKPNERPVLTASGRLPDFIPEAEMPEAQRRANVQRLAEITQGLKRGMAS